MVSAPLKYKIVLATDLEGKVKMNDRVIIDEDECIGCGSCEDICPEVFKTDHAVEKSIVIKPEGGPRDLIEEAMGECPMSCIFWD